MTDTQSNYLYFYCSNLQNVEAYQSLCEKNKIPVLFFSNYEEISQAIRSQLPLGIIFDQKSLFGISNDLKMFISEAELVLPILKVVRNKENGEVSGIIGTMGYNDGELFKAFYHEYAPNFNRRGFRTEKRIPKNLPISLITENSTEEIPGVTINISPNGMFILSFGDFYNNQIVGVRILSLGESHIYTEGEVRWARRFSSFEESLPGLGIFFKKINPLYKDKYFT